MSRNQHQERVLQVVRCIEPDRWILPERAVPRAARSIDAIIGVGEPAASWGPIAPLVAWRLVAIEHFSAPPSVAACVRSASKLGHLADEWWARRRGGDLVRSGRWTPLRASSPPEEPDAETFGRRPPLLLILSDGTPRLALVALDLALGIVPGTWQATRRALGDILLLSLRALPRTDGCAALRMMVQWEDRREARAAIHDLLADRRVLQSTKDGLLEEMMKGNVPMSSAEQGSILEKLRAQFREEAREEGRLEGRLEGAREELLAVARMRCDAETLRELTALDDIDDLRRRVLSLLSDC